MNCADCGSSGHTEVYCPKWNGASLYIENDWIIEEYVENDWLVEEDDEVIEDTVDFIAEM